MILGAIQKYALMGTVAALVIVSLVAGYLYLNNGKLEATVKLREQELSQVVELNKSQEMTIATLEKDKEKLDGLLLDSEEINKGLEKEYDRTIGKINAAKEDDNWNRGILVPCSVTNSLWPDKKLGCRPQANN